ncbi:SDR family NAD(P)-dependent oxidoreductase [Streptomyces sp. NPDC049813]|uniref:SDR family NAD(P)-dependent oxidoreductase n=1 Tax=Streptomyces sp. NPDC049813 TaxID=3365597 RepID=UPI0037AEEC14
MRGLAGKTVIVTGGAQGIGRAVADRVVQEGGNVVIADSHTECGKSAAQEIDETAGRPAALFVHTDVSDEESVRSMTVLAAEHFGGVDQLVNCAAVFIMRGLEATVEEWRRIMDVNIMGQALCVKHAAPYMRKRGAGSVVNIASISGHIAQPGYLTYNATKAAVANMTRCMAMDLAPDRIRVNAVNPGTVWNKNNERFHREQLGMDRAQADADPEIGGRHMLGRTADPEEIASAVAFLLSEEASYITGENLMVDAGYTAM